MEEACIGAETMRGQETRDKRTKSHQAPQVTGPAVSFPEACPEETVKDGDSFGTQPEMAVH